MIRGIALTIVFLLCMSAIARAARRHTAHVVVFAGASETFGMGLQMRKHAYPYLVGGECGVRVRVYAAPGVSVFSEPLTRAAVEANIVFLSQIDAMARTPEPIVRGWLEARVASGPTLILEAPPITQLFSDWTSIAEHEAKFYRLIRQMNLPITIWPLSMPRSETDLLQADGLHPNARGHKALALVVTAWLKSKNLC